MCEGLFRALSAHLPGCSQCEKARQSVSGVLDPADLSFPCAEGLALLNNHLDSCTACRADVRGSVRGFAELLGAPEGPAS